MNDEDLRELRKIARSEAISGRAIQAKLTALRTLERLERQRERQGPTYSQGDPLRDVDLDDFNLRMAMVSLIDACFALSGGIYDSAQLDAAWQVLGEETRAGIPNVELWPEFRERALAGDLGLPVRKRDSDAGACLRRTLGTIVQCQRLAVRKLRTARIVRRPYTDARRTRE